MDYMLFAFMAVLLLYTVYRNFTLLKRYKQNKEYIECYKAILRADENAYERINAFIDSQKEQDFAGKGRLLKLYVELDKKLPYQETLNAIDLKDVFYKKDHPDKYRYSLNCELFIWIYIIMAKARQMSGFDVLNELNDKVKALEEMNDCLEYREAEAIYNALCEKEDGGVKFFTDLLEGNYTELRYEKNLIGTFKRFAAATLAYGGEPMEDYYKQDLHNFAETMIGKTYLENLGIYDKYLPLKETAETEE